MRKLMALSILLLAAACSDHLSVSPTTIDLAVGQTATITATRIPSTYTGIPWPPNRIDFVGNGPISVGGVMGANESLAFITVQGVSPGTGTVTTSYRDAHTPGLIMTPIATVNVYDCSTPMKLAPEFANVSGKIGEPAILRVTPTVTGGHFQWYWGNRGDTHTPISFTDTPYFIDFTPRANGSYPIWVRYSSPCGTADAAFVVSVGVQHRRAVR
ncbi:MAG TPA: hypothetical protein VN605_14195 [Thermoanaerobaculia bacterium]|nr:hypothetical protein [Thermoanaerobaculia bacterium]